MTAEYPHGDEPLIPMPALSLPALRQAVATVAPSRLPEFFQEIQDAFTQAGDEDSVFPIRHFYQRWGAAIAIERAALDRRPAPRRRTSPRRPRPRCPGPGSSGSRRDRPGGLPRGRGCLTGTGKPVTDDLLDGLSPAALAAVRQVAENCARSMIFLDGREFTGEPPGLRTIQRGPLMLVYLTDVRGARVVIIQVNWIG